VASLKVSALAGAAAARLPIGARPSPGWFAVGRVGAQPLVPAGSPPPHAGSSLAGKGRKAPLPRREKGRMR
jgi:hypothetical protein